MSKELNKPTFTFTRHTSFQSIADTLKEGIIQAYKDCPDSENKTFEEIAEWAGRHVLLSEKVEDL